MAPKRARRAAPEEEDEHVLALDDALPPARAEQHTSEPEDEGAGAADADAEEEQGERAATAAAQTAAIPGAARRAAMANVARR